MNMELNVQAFLKVIDSQDNTTGGGTASSISGAMAAGLTSMVARLSMKIMDKKENYEEIASLGDSLAKALFDGGRNDSDAFAMVSAAYKMPKDNEEEKMARRNAIQKGMVHAAQVPLENARGCKKVLDLAKVLGKKFNTNAASDLECAVNLAHAGLIGCMANVRINIPYIKDKEICRELESSLEELSNQEARPKTTH